MKLPSLQGERGFTLLEVLVSISIFTIAAIGIAKSYTDHLSANTVNERKSEAFSAAQRVLDNLRVQDPATLPSSGSAAPQTITFGPRDYVVTVSYCTQPQYCSSTNIRQLHVQVSLNNESLYEVDTVYAQLR